MKISVIGIGYVGLVTAVCFAEKGHEVICFDTDEQKINMLNKGKTPIYEQGLDELINKNKDRITYTTDKKLVYDDAKTIFICVGTPESEDGSADLKYIYIAADDIVEHIKNDCLIVLKSTIPVGTSNKVSKYIEEKLNGRLKIQVAFNPEFLAQGSAVRDTLKAQRIVVGTKSEKVKNILNEIYKDFKDSVILFTDINTAEMIKYASNCFLALKISYINEIANLCELVDANILDVSKGMGLDSRIGNEFLNSGIGYGGACFPKDTKALYKLANENGCELKTVKATIEVNKKQRLRLIEKLKKYYKTEEGLNIAVLGLTFKPGTDDLREAPSIENIKQLSKAKVKVWDPLANEKVENRFDYVTCCNTIDETIENADVCFIFTELEEIKKYDVKKYQKLMKKPIILDGRNCYSHNEFKGTNIIYESIGRKTIG